MAIRHLARARISRKVIAIIVVVLAIVIPSCFVDWFEIQRRIPVATYRRVELAILVSIEIAYVVAFIAAGVTAPVLGLAILSARRRGRVTTRLARLLLCACSVLIALLIAELTTVALGHRV